MLPVSYRVRLWRYEDHRTVHLPVYEGDVREVRGAPEERRERGRAPALPLQSQAARHPASLDFGSAAVRAGSGDYVRPREACDALADLLALVDARALGNVSREDMETYSDALRRSLEALRFEETIGAALNDAGIDPRARDAFHAKVPDWWGRVTGNPAAGREPGHEDVERFQNAAQAADENARLGAEIDRLRHEQDVLWFALLTAWRALPVGTRVALRELRDGPEVLITKTRSEPWPLGHGMPVIKVEGKVGGWALECLRPLADGDETLLAALSGRRAPHVDPPPVGGSR